MRRRRLLMLCLVGVAVCLFIAALQQSPPSNDLLTTTLPLQDGNDDEIIVASWKRLHKEQSQYQSLRYLAPVHNTKDLFDDEQRHLDTATITVTSPVQPRFAGSSSGRRHKFARSKSEKAPDWPSSVYYDRNSPPAKFRVWNSSRTEICPSSVSSGNTVNKSQGQMTAYAVKFAELRNVVVDRKYFVSSGLKGGEMINDVIGQDESEEYYRVERGCFRLTCRTLSELAPYHFHGNTHLDKWYANGIQLENVGRWWQRTTGESDGVSVFDGFTVAVVRYEYANLFHTMTDWYNAFLMMQFFGQTAADTNILIVDAHPFGALDSVWTRLFGSVTRLSALRQQTRFRQLVWNIVGYESPMTIYASSPYPPLFEEFRNHFLSSYNIEDHPTSQARNCSALRVQFIWRRDYLAHPRNPSGQVQRKIANERELVEFVQRRNPGFQVSGVQIDLLDIGDQLRRIVAADIVVGVHGAGLTHALFMKRNAGLAEIVPNQVWASNEHFKAIAGWRGLHYIRWTNHDFTREDDDRGTLKVPPYIANALVTKLAKQICHQSTKSPSVTQRTHRRRYRRASKRSSGLIKSINR